MSGKTRWASGEVHEDWVSKKDSEGDWELLQGEDLEGYSKEDIQQELEGAFHAQNSSGPSRSGLVQVYSSNLILSSLNPK